MRLTLHTDYALRLLMDLAVAEGELRTIADIAERFCVSRNHLMKVSLDLTRDGLVESLRGRGGGLRLARPPEMIRIGAVVRAMEVETGPVECLQAGESACPIERACRLKAALRKAAEAFFDVLDQYTLADLTTANPVLATLLERKAS